MPNWELFKSRKGGRKTLGYLRASEKASYLYIGKLLREQGLDPTKRYDLLFDKAGRVLGLRESVDGYKPTAQSNGYVIRLKAFCEHFELCGWFEVESASKEGDVWALNLRSSA